MSLDYTLESDVKPNGDITQTLKLCGEQLSQWVMSTRDQATRDALIRLGWTPPAGDRYNLAK